MEKDTSGSRVFNFRLGLQHTTWIWCDKVFSVFLEKVTSLIVMYDINVLNMGSATTTSKV